MSSAKVKTANDVLHELWAIADEMGHNYVYPHPRTGCSYVKEEQSDDPIFPAAMIGPGCFIGHWLYGHGLTLATLRLNEGSISEKWDDFRPLLDFSITDQALQLLEEVQSLQDAGHRWGQALQMATAILGIETD